MTGERVRCVPETPFGARLRAARKMAGLSMEDLAGKLGGLVTKQAISKYEQGRMRPSAEVLEKLVAVLKDATWGASPLRISDRELVEIRDEESPFLFCEENVAGRRFRRAGLLSRLLRRGDGEPKGPDAPAEEAAKGGVYCLIQPAAAGLKRHEPAGEPELRKVSLIPRGEGFSGLAARRARIIRDWGSGGPLDEVRFRPGEKLPAKSEEALRYRIADYLRKYLEIESVLGMSADFQNPVAGRPPALTPEDVEGAAEEARRRWELGSGPIVNLLGLLEDKGVKVYEARGIEGFEGLSGRYGERPFVAVSLDHPADRIRFTAAHELGHVLCDFGPAEGPESECRAFGAAFLLPRAALEKAFLPSRRKVILGDLAEIKRAYGISFQAVMSRAHGLGLIGDRQIKSFRETFKARGWAVTEPMPYAGEERASRFRRLLRYAVAAGIIALDRAAEIAGVPEAELENEIGDVF